MADEPVSFLIVGAGVFGASTAVALAERYPSKTIALVDREFPCRQSASWDWSKVVRADYPDIFYTKLALEAKAAWRSDPLYSQHYHETGIVWVDDSGFSKNVIENYRSLGVDEQWSMVAVGDLRTRYGGVFAEAALGDREEVYLNESSGWVEASKALSAVIQAAAAAGVRLVEMDVSALLLREDGGCTGIKAVDSREIAGETVILTTGAETARLLVKSAPDRPKLHAGNRMTAAGLVTGMLELDADEMARYQGTPSFLHASGPAQGGAIPPNAKNELKITCDRSFVNTTKVSGICVSAPPTDPESVHESLWKEMQSALTTVSDAIIGAQMRNSKDFQGCRICWDTITPTQDLLITPHPECENLYVAGGGSFHAWKFFPLLGRCVVQMLEGSLAPEAAQRWAWDCRSTYPTNKRMIPTREMGDLKSEGEGRSNRTSQNLERTG